MNILYDATPLLMRSAGVKNYHHALLSNLIEVLPPHRIKLFPALKQITENDNEGSNYSRLATAIRLGGIVGSNYLQVPLPSFLTSGADLFHVTQLPRQLPRSMPLSSVVHDPTPVLLPHCHTQSNVRYFRYFVDNNLPRLRAILVPSQAVRDDIVEHLHVPAEKVSVVYHGVAEDFFDAPLSSVYLARQTYRLPERYLLFVGALEPRKNLATLIDAIQLLPPELQRRYPLVVAGTSGWKNSRVRRRLSRLKHAHSLGYVRRPLLPAVYSSASLFVFPSLYEGFGMPLLEAMAARLPIVSSNVSAIPEVVGTGGLLVDPKSPTEIAAAIEHILEDPGLASVLGETGRQRARRFTWRKTAENTKIFFEKALGS